MKLLKLLLLLGKEEQQDAEKQELKLLALAVKLLAIAGY
jgi:hypothetical protein